MLKVRRILTEILLEATEKQVQLIAKEEHRRFRPSGIVAFLLFYEIPTMLYVQFGRLKLKQVKNTISVMIFFFF